jgi:hypothetical protein
MLLSNCGQTLDLMSKGCSTNLAAQGFTDTVPESVPVPAVSQAHWWPRAGSFRLLLMTKVLRAKCTVGAGGPQKNNKGNRRAVRKTC